MSLTLRKRGLVLS